MGAGLSRDEWEEVSPPQMVVHSIETSDQRQAMDKRALVEQMHEILCFDGDDEVYEALRIGLDEATRRLEATWG